MEAKSGLIDGSYTYFAFIAYKHDDYDKAKKLRDRLQSYALPRKVKDEDKPKRLIPIFLDHNDLQSGEYERVDEEALSK